MHDIPYRLLIDAEATDEQATFYPLGGKSTDLSHFGCCELACVDTFTPAQALRMKSGATSISASQTVIMESRPAAFTARRSPPDISISNIVSMRTQEKVTRIYACRLIAAMADEYSRRDRAICEFPCETMGADTPNSVPLRNDGDTPVTVTIACPSPPPTAGDGAGAQITIKAILDGHWGAPDFGHGSNYSSDPPQRQANWSPP